MQHQSTTETHHQPFTHNQWCLVSCYVQRMHLLFIYSLDQSVTSALCGFTWGLYLPDRVWLTSHINAQPFETSYMWECPIRSGTHKSTHTHQVMQSTSPLPPAQWTLPHCDVTEGRILKRLNNMTPSGKMWGLISLRAPSYLSPFPSSCPTCCSQCNLSPRTRE